MTTLETEVCIVGAGVAGGIVAQHCIDAGLDVVVLDAGGAPNGRAAHLRLVEQLVRDYRIARMKLWRGSRYRTRDYRSVGNRFYELDGKSVLARGGSTLGWGGDAYRLQPEDFRLRSSTGIGSDWAVDYEELEPHYGAGEQTLRVAGDHLDGGHPPRSVAFPLPARRFAARDQTFLQLLAERGWPSMHHPLALATDGGAFTGDELFDPLDAQANFRLLTHSAVTRVVEESRGRVSGVEYREGESGELRRVRAEVVVICGGGIETPTLLLRSTSDWSPDGLGNHSGHLGRHLVSHTGLALGGRPRGFRLFDGPIGPTVSTRQFDSADEQPNGKYLLLWRPAPSGLLFLNANLEQLPSESNRVTPGSGSTRFGTPVPVVDFNHEDADVQREEACYRELVALADRIGLEIGHERRFVLAHPMCTARMAVDPADGVVDGDLRIHGVDNAFVCGSASFASGAAANPTLTIAALAHRLGAHLTSEVIAAGGNSG